MNGRDLRDTDIRYRELANAIITAAAKDYRKEVIKAQHYLNHETPETQKLEEFFRSEHFQLLTDVDGEYIIKQIRAMVRREFTGE